MRQLLVALGLVLSGTTLALSSSVDEVPRTIVIEAWGPGTCAWPESTVRVDVRGNASGVEDVTLHRTSHYRIMLSCDRPLST